MSGVLRLPVNAWVPRANTSTPTAPPASRLPSTLETFRSVSEKLLYLSKLSFHEFEVLLRVLDVLRLKRRLRLGRIRLHALLSRNNVSAKVETLGTLCTLKTIETGVGRCLTRGNLIHFVVQFSKLGWIGPRRLRARLTLSLGTPRLRRLVLLVRRLRCGCRHRCCIGRGCLVRRRIHQRTRCAHVTRRLSGCGTIGLRGSLPIRSRLEPARRRKSCGHKNHENDHGTQRDVKAAMSPGTRLRRRHLPRKSFRSRRTRAGQRRGRQRHRGSLCSQTCSDVLQRVPKRIRRLEPSPRFFCHGHQDDLVQRFWQIRFDLDWRP